MKYKITILILLFFISSLIFFDFCMAGEIKSFGKINKQSINVSFLELTANPELYHNKQIRLIGVMKLEIEGNSIFLSKEHYQYDVTRNAFWISLSPLLEKQKAEIKKLNGKYVLLEGIFKKDRKGHMGLYMGTITNINRIIDYEAAFKYRT